MGQTHPGSAYLQTSGQLNDKYLYMFLAPLVRFSSNKVLSEHMIINIT